ncbi:SPOR domain-containing protein [Ottowia testudinis]|uniref:SPOR domain-containing protein n=1 Tax=Ottowia testudinis TaxID=2816950 RepID=A0A975CI82_9BURK|nr:SPOR domain-containing protein [Ottowia testudinis]QTD45566.1 SPOR domain-containing protein [Ottowia testudinis]
MAGRLVVLLLVANAAWFAWSQGWLRVLGLAPTVQTEPERLQRQLRPEALKLRPLESASAPRAPALAETPPAAGPVPAAPAAAAVAEAPLAPQPAPAGVCLQAGVFDQRQVEPVRRAAASLPAGSWRIDSVQLPGRWMVYVGKLADADAVRAKRSELRELGVDTDRPGAALEPGLSLGRFSSEEAAERALTDLGRKGVRTARVVQERRDTPAFMLRLPSADAALRQQATRELRKALGGKDLRECDTP